jgi:hypothetical protein
MVAVGGRVVVLVYLVDSFKENFCLKISIRRLFKDDEMVGDDWHGDAGAPGGPLQPGLDGQGGFTLHRQRF